MSVSATADGGIGQVKCKRGPLPQPPWYPFRTLGHLPKRILFRSSQICALHLTLPNHCNLATSRTRLHLCKDIEAGYFLLSPTMMGRSHPGLDEKCELSLFLGRLLGHDERFIQATLTAARYLAISCAICIRKLPSVDLLSTTSHPDCANMAPALLARILASPVRANL